MTDCACEYGTLTSLLIKTCPAHSRVIEAINEVAVVRGLPPLSTQERHEIRQRISEAEQRGGTTMTDEARQRSDGSFRDPLRPPAKRVRSELAKAAGRIERLKLKLRKQNKAIEQTKADLYQAKRFLTSIIEDAAPEMPADPHASGAVYVSPDITAAIDELDAESRVFGIGAGGDTEESPRPTSAQDDFGVRPI